MDKIRDALLPWYYQWETEVEATLYGLTAIMEIISDLGRASVQLLVFTDGLKCPSVVWLNWI